MGSTQRWLRVATSNNRSVPSALPEATNLPSGLNITIAMP
jgi:hypothetical protein